MLIENFKHEKLLRCFEAVSAIPRPSYHEKAIADYIVSFATERGLECYRDEMNNVLVNIPATNGRENEEAILLQGHTDMVCEKNKGVDHDFMTDPIKLCVKDGWIRAEGTTLGADNGVAVAAMLAIMDGAAENHVALQCLFTTSEEVGLDGANAFDYSKIFARKMVNMDSADESLIIAGCAGGLRSDVAFTGKRAENDFSAYYRISVGGLFGGHSGEDIHRGRANANKLLGRVLYELSEAGEKFAIVSINGGSKENAIPRESEAVVAFSNEEKIKVICNKISSDILSEICPDDVNFALKVEKTESDIKPFDKEFSEKIVYIIFTSHNGVIDLKGGELAGTVEYSRNLGVITTKDDCVQLVFNTRSSMETRLDLAERELDALAKRFGGVTDHYSRYPGWVFAEDSEIRNAYKTAYSELLGGEPEVEVIHAGLECGIIKKAIPDMDMISCGPIVMNLHSPDEALNIESFERFFSVILNVIK